MVYPFRKSVYWSAAIHGGVFLFLILSPYLPFEPYGHRKEKVTWINLPRGTGGLATTGMKKSEGLPKSTIQEQKKLPAEKARPQKKTPSMTYKTNQKGQEQGLKKPKEKTEEEKRMEEILARAKQEVSRRKSVEPEAAQIAKGAPGGIPDGSTTGPYSTGDDPERAQYVLLIKQTIIKEWMPSYNLRDPSLGLICKIIIRINEKGEIIEIHWTKKSGNESYDLSALRAIMKAVPLKPPPERLKIEAIHEGYEFTFDASLLNKQT
ncbi:MAG: TonB C-terminal domain-containing protein [Deltaproteobacteria bacterium]|nr:TonB C-terminal domain-containing protein [Deltaproteobacteria bacterium]